MSVEYRTGDLFEFGFPAMAHGVNIDGLMGSGIAPLFRRRWPAMYEAYREECRSGRLTLGGLFPWQAPDGTWIYNAASQDRPGRHAKLHAVESSLRAAVEHAEAHGVPVIGMPRIGAGIGGLNWPDVAATVEQVAAASPVRVVVVSLPGADARPARWRSARQ